MMYDASVIGKWLSMLKEIAPRLGRAALVINPKSAPYYRYFLHAAEAVAPSLGIEIVFSPVENAAADVERTIETFARVPDGVNDGFQGLSGRRDRIFFLGKYPPAGVSQGSVLR
jgi:putative ABC transport system substrate-binding protein